MPLSQVSDRIKEVPGQVLRTVFGGIGKILMGADKVRSEVADQLGGSGHPDGAEQGAPAAPPRPADETPARAPARTVTSDTAAKPDTAARPAPETAKPEGSRWRSLDETGNVRMLDDAEQAGEAGAAPAAAAAEPGTALAEPESADLVARPPAELAEPAPAELVTPEPAQPAEPTPAAFAEPVPAEPIAPEPIAPEAAAPGAAEPERATPALPVPGYDELSVASLRARLRFLDPAGIRTLLEYENAHQGRAAVITMFERRLSKLEEGS
jgi:hypothetical protein